MPKSETIDVHAHILAEETIALMRSEAPTVGFKLTRIDDNFAEIDIAGAKYRPFPRGAWDMDQRLTDMDFAGIDRQVISNTPQTFLYNQDAAVGATLSALQNDQIAKAVAANPERLTGLATLPMQEPRRAADELDRAMGRLRLKGAHIGSNVNGRNLDDPTLEPIWAVANKLSALIMVHPTPTQIAGIERLRSYYLNNIIGNPLETTIAAAALVFGGVIERYPNIQFLLVHGGGFVPYQAGRFEHGWQVRSEPKVHLKASPKASLRQLRFDTLLHGKPALEFLVANVGPSRVLLGSDYPFDMGTLECVRQVRALSITEPDKTLILGDNATATLDSSKGS